MNSVNSWPYLDLIIPDTLVDLCLDLCWTFNPLGVVEDMPKKGVYRVFYKDSKSCDAARKQLSLMEWSASVVILTQDEIVDPGWRTTWHKYFKPANIAERFVILPTWESIPDTRRIPLIIDPGQAFGTGQHETTHLCLKLLEVLNPDGKTILDAGCGSGILGIAAVKLGAASVCGRDHEVEAVQEAVVNSKVNQVTDKCEWISGDVTEEEGGYDLVLGNINTIFLIANASFLVSRVLVGGHLIISGFLVVDRLEIEQTFSDAGCELISRDAMGEWSAALFRRIE